MELRNRIKGCLYAGAIGDCIGGYFENNRSASVYTDFQWKISDDTQLILATCESLIETSRILPSGIAEKFLLWFGEGRITGVGSSTLTALKGLQAGGHWALVGRQGEYAAGNGAAMRIAPMAFLNPTRQVIADVCRITHRNDEAYVGALAIFESVRAAISGRWQPGASLIPMIVDLLPDTRVAERRRELSRETAPISAVSKKYGSSGYVVDSVPLAIYAAQQIGALSLPEIFTEVITSSQDTDTICSMAGNIIGSFIGFEALQQEYCSKLRGVREADIFTKIVEKFCNVADRIQD